LVQRKELPPVWLVSFAPPGAEEGERRLVETGIEKAGMRGAFPWRQDKLRENAFFRGHPRLLELCGNVALGLWKPAIILEQLRMLPKGDVVLYHDVIPGYWGDYSFRRTVAPVIAWALEFNDGVLPGVWIPEDGRNARWTPRSSFVALEADAEPFWNAPQILTTYGVWQHNERAIALLEDWLSACVRVYETQRSDLPDFPDFVTDRGAQSLLSIVAQSAAVGCYGQAYESTSDTFHPRFPPIPASNIGNLLTRLERDARSGRLANRKPITTHADASKFPARALFTSIPPRLDRTSRHGHEIGDDYQNDCIRSWLEAGFEIYSIHFHDELPTIKRRPGVNYVGIQRTDDDRPHDYKPSLQAILGVVERVGAGLSGLINSDILLKNSPGWVDAIEREVAGSVIAVTRYETNEIDHTCIGRAPWGIDLFFLDRSFIADLKYCGMRIGETWWDYWLPLWCYFLGAELKYVDDYIALHLDHIVVSSERVLEYGKKFFEAITNAAEAAKARSEQNRMTDFYRYCRHRISIDEARLGISDEDSPQFFIEIVNPVIWAWIRDLLRRRRLEVIAKPDPQHRFLGELVVRSAENTEDLRSRIASGHREVGELIEDYRKMLGIERAPTPPGVLLMEHVRKLSVAWPYRFESWLGDAIRYMRGKPPRPKPTILTPADAIALYRRMRRRLLWRVTSRVHFWFERLAKKARQA
jgi:hypothetical protein